MININALKYSQPFAPQVALRKKYILYVLSLYGGSWAAFNIVTFFIIKTGFQKTLGWPSTGFAGTFLFSTTAFSVVIMIAIWYTGVYYNSILFEIMEDEVHVNKGVITKTRKIVPYRTITNVEIKQGPYDRILGLGTIELQTAGFSSNKRGPEERIDGLPSHELEIIQTLIIDRVRNVRGSPATIQERETTGSEDVLIGIHKEFKELGKILLKKNGE
ncbi:MAG: PH domain-containing protein [Candidatus Kariarchaeaceae archaeon]